MYELKKKKTHLHNLLILKIFRDSYWNISAYFGKWNTWITSGTHMHVLSTYSKYLDGTFLVAWVYQNDGDI